MFINFYVLDKKTCVNYIMPSRKTLRAKNSKVRKSMRRKGGAAPVSNISGAKSFMDMVFGMLAKKNVSGAVNSSGYKNSSGSVNSSGSGFGFAPFTYGF